MVKSRRNRDESFPMIVFGIRPTSKESLKISLGSDVIEFSAFCVTR